MTSRHRSLAAVLVLCAATAGCATRGSPSGTAETAALPGTHSVSAQSLRDAVVSGSTTKAQLLSRLGKTTSVVFDSGFEVWIYQYRDEAMGAATQGARDKSEFVVLIAPSGIVTRTRIRIAPAAAAPARPAAS